VSNGLFQKFANQKAWGIFKAVLANPYWKIGLIGGRQKWVAKPRIKMQVSG